MIQNEIYIANSGLIIARIDAIIESKAQLFIDDKRTERKHYVLGTFWRKYRTDNSTNSFIQRLRIIECEDGDIKSFRIDHKYYNNQIQDKLTLEFYHKLKGIPAPIEDMIKSEDEDSNMLGVDYVFEEHKNLNLILQ